MAKLTRFQMSPLSHTLLLHCCCCCCCCRRPFHPKRLHAFLRSHFTLQQPDWSSDASHGISCDDVNCTRKHPAPPTTGGRAAAAVLAPLPTGAAVFPAGPASTTVPAAQAAGRTGDAALASHDAAPGIGASAELRGLALDLSREAQGIALLLPPSSSSIASLGASSADLAASAARLAQAAAAASSLAKAVLATVAATSAGASKPGTISSSSVAAALAPTTAEVGAPALLGQPLLRSRGFAWVAGAGREDHCCEWSQAGGVITLGTGGPWYCVLPRYVPGGGVNTLGTGGPWYCVLPRYVPGGGVITLGTGGPWYCVLPRYVIAVVRPAVGLVLTERSLLWSPAPLGGLGQSACVYAQSLSPEITHREIFLIRSLLKPYGLSSSASQGGVAQ